MARKISKESLIEAIGDLDDGDSFFSSILANEVSRVLGIEVNTCKCRDQLLGMLLDNFSSDLLNIVFTLDCRNYVLGGERSIRDQAISILNWVEDNNKVSELIDCMIKIVEKGNFGEPEKFIEELNKLKDEV